MKATSSISSPSTSSPTMSGTSSRNTHQQPGMRDPLSPAGKVKVRALQGSLGSGQDHLPHEVLGSARLRGQPGEIRPRPSAGRHLRPGIRLQNRLSRLTLFRRLDQQSRCQRNRPKLKDVPPRMCKSLGVTRNAAHCRERERTESQMTNITGWCDLQEKSRRSYNRPYGIYENDQKVGGTLPQGFPQAGGFPSRENYAPIRPIPEAHCRPPPTTQSASNS